jgi:uncharacterized protein YqgQ
MIYIGVLLYGLISYLIGEFFGRAKHIGIWWTMFLFWSAPIPLIGLLALIFSPSAKKAQTSKYNSIWLGLGILLLLLSLIPLINIFSTYSTLRQFGYVFFTALAVHGIYFILLGTDKITNSNPKYYLKDMNINLPKLNVEEKTEDDAVILKNDKTEDLKVADNESPIQISENNENDELIQLQKLFDLGVVNLEEFNAKKILIEEKRIAEDELKQKKLELELAKENFKKKVEENDMALISLKSLLDSGILTQEEYNSKVAIINESEKADKKALDNLLYGQSNSSEVYELFDKRDIIFLFIILIIAIALVIIGN